MSIQALIPKNAFFIESGTYQPVLLRPYETNYNESVALDFNSITENGSRIVPNAFANMASSIIAPSAAHQGIIDIANGWQERRMSFMLEIEVADSFGESSKVIVLTGYTDYTDVGMITNAFDPRMRLYLNTSTVITVMTQRNANGSISQRKMVTDSSHLLNSVTMNNIRTTVAQNDPYAVQSMWYATPSNVINEMISINENSTDVYTQSSSRRLKDFRQEVGNTGVKRSRRENTIPTTYLSKILRGVHDNLSSMASGIADDERGALMNASVGVRENDLTIDPVIVQLSMNSDYSQNGFVTWGELCAIVPNIDRVTKYTNRASAVVNTGTPEASSGNFQGWQGVTYETAIANSIAQLVPAMMTTCMIGQISFVFNNDNITATPSLHIINGMTMVDGIPFLNMAQTFETRFLSEVAPQITDQGRTIVNMMVQCSLGTETYINISRNGEPDVPFCAPTFCDSLYTPVLSPSHQGIVDVASDLQNIANSVNTVQYSNNQPQMQYGVY